MTTEIEKLAQRIETVADEATALDCAVYDVFGEEHFADMKRLAAYVLRIAPAVEALREVWNRNAGRLIEASEVRAREVGDAMDTLLAAAEVKP